MNANDQATLDYTLRDDGSVWDMGASFADFAHRAYGTSLEVSGDVLARIRADLREIGGADCD